MASNASGKIKRWYCVKCDNRMLPYDGYESLTEVAMGRKVDGKPSAILLHSANSKLRDTARREGKDYSCVGYCWVCKTFRSGYQLTQMDLLKRYFERSGVVIRTQSRGMKAAVEELLQRRAG